MTQDGQRLAYSGGAAIKPGGVQGYLSRAFKDRLGDAKVGAGGLEQGGFQVADGA